MRVAAYARYSSDAQRDASLDDQLRNCRQYAERQGWPAPVAFTDAAVSGARQDRQGYGRLMDEAERFDVILVDDLTRLSRDNVECQRVVKRLTFAGVRLIGVSDGLDTGRKNHKADVGLRGLMGELYLDDLREKTHRGLTGRALSGASAGGLPYGYRVAGVGQRAIDETEAQVVRRVFADYLTGHSPRAIASALNAEGVPSPRGGLWAMSAIYGDTKRGIGLLANPIYIGRQVWNRSQWIKHPDTGRRVRRNRPPSEWVTTEHPDLAIIDAATWEAVQRRLRAAQPLAVVTAGAGPGRPMKYLLSGLLRCPECGGPMVIVDRYRYGCGTHKDRGESACPSRLRVSRVQVESALLAGIQSDLLTDAAFERVKAQVSAALKRHQPDKSKAAAALTDAQRVHGNIMAAIRAGIITPSTKAELERAEAALQSAQDAMRPSPTLSIIPRLRDRWNATVAALANRARNIPAAREAIRDLLGERITLRNENGDLFAEIAASDCQLKLVAGARFQLCDAYALDEKPGKALPLCRQAVAAYRALGDDYGVGDAENDVGIALATLNQVDEAAAAYERSREFFAKVKAEQLVVMVGDNLAQMYLKQGRAREALALSRASLKQELATGRISDALNSSTDIARAEAALGHHRQAYARMREAVVQARKAGINGQLIDMLKVESELAEQAGDLRQALADEREAARLGSTVDTPALRAIEVELEQRYAVREKELRIGELEHANELKDLQLKAAEADAARRREQQRRQRLVNLTIALLAAALLLIVGLLVLLLRSQRRHAAELQAQTLRDPLTGMANRRAFQQRAIDLLGRPREASAPLHVLLLIDIDHFKTINDSIGHPQGDRVLRVLTDYLRGAVGEASFVARIGGEEFAVLCPQAGLTSGMRLAEALRAGAAALALPEDLPVDKLTISIGVAQFDGARCHDLSSWMRAADLALYSAKSGGRDQVAASKLAG